MCRCDILFIFCFLCFEGSARGAFELKMKDASNQDIRSNDSRLFGDKIIFVCNFEQLQTSVEYFYKIFLQTSEDDASWTTEVIIFIMIYHLRFSVFNLQIIQ